MVMEKERRRSRTGAMAPGNHKGPVMVMEKKERKKEREAGKMTYHFIVKKHEWMGTFFLLTIA